MKIWSQKPTTWAICPTSQCLNEHAGSILWLWVNKTCTYILLKWKWNIYECKWNIFLWLFLLRASAMMACRRHATLHTLAAQCCVAGILPVVWKNKQYTFGKIGKTLRIVDTSSREIFQGHKSYSPVSAATNVSKIFVFNVEKKKKDFTGARNWVLCSREVIRSQFPHIYCQHKYGTSPWDAPQRVIMTIGLAATGSDAQL